MRVTEIDVKQSRPRSWLQVLSVSLIVGLFALSIFTASSYSSPAAQTSAQGAITGVWTAEYPIDKNDKIQLSLSRKRDGHSNNMGFDISLSELAGLSREQALAGKSYVKFRLVREAGTFEFEGSFANGKGAGFWTLVPSQTFISEMRSRGYDNLGEEKLVTSAMLDVRTRAIDDLKAAGFTQLSLEDVFKATIFKVTPAFISELKSIGFDNLDLEDLVKARIFKVDAQFAREVEAMGFGRNSLESLVKMRIFKVTPDFLRDMRSAGLDNLSIEDLVKLRIFNIDTAFIQRVKANGRTDVDVEDLVRIKIHNDMK
jgi:hypothetical protein